MNFEVSYLDSDRIYQWQKRHIEKYHEHLPRFIYSFTPDPDFGTFGNCTCGECRQMAQIDAVRDGKYDQFEYNKYMKEHEAYITYTAY